MAKKKINTFSALAIQLGVSKNQLSNIHSNRYKSVKANVEELAKSFGINSLELIKDISISEKEK